MATAARQLRSGRPATARRAGAPPLALVTSRPARWTRRMRLALWAGSLVALLSLLLVVGAYAYLTQGQARLAHMQDQLQSQLSTHQQLETQVAKLEEPSRVLSVASGQGLVEPQKVNELPAANVYAPQQGNGAPEGTSGPSSGASAAR